MILFALGGMLTFFAFGLLLVAAIELPGFWVVCISLAIVAGALVATGYRIRKVNIERWERRTAESAARAKCGYCGARNPEGTTVCGRCGAPLL
jgi:hypothetical protein